MVSEPPKKPKKRRSSSEMEASRRAKTLRGIIKADKATKKGKKQ